MVELADMQDLGSCAFKACGFDSHWAHHKKYKYIDRINLSMYFLFI